MLLCSGLLMERSGRWVDCDVITGESADRTKLSSIQFACESPGGMESVLHKGGAEVREKATLRPTLRDVDNGPKTAA